MVGTAGGMTERALMRQIPNPEKSILAQENVRMP